MTDVLTCPGCGQRMMPANAQLTADPPPGACMSCIKCANIYVYDGDAWRAPSTSERADMLQSEGFIQIMSYQQELMLWEQRDRATITACVMPFLLALASSATTVDMASADIAAALWDGGFHKHSDMEVPDDDQ